MWFPLEADDREARTWKWPRMSLVKLDKDTGSPSLEMCFEAHFQDRGGELPGSTVRFLGPPYVLLRGRSMAPGDRGPNSREP